MTATSARFLTSEVEVRYQILPADFLLDLPTQIDITGVFITLVDKKGRRRRVDILSSVGESELLALEDEIADEINIKKSLTVVL